MKTLRVYVLRREDTIKRLRRLKKPLYDQTTYGRSSFLNLERCHSAACVAGWLMRWNYHKYVDWCAKLEIEVFSPTYYLDFVAYWLGLSRDEAGMLCHADADHQTPIRAANYIQRQFLDPLS